MKTHGRFSCLLRLNRRSALVEGRLILLGVTKNELPILPVSIGRNLSRSRRSGTSFYRGRVLDMHIAKQRRFLARLKPHHFTDDWFAGRERHNCTNLDPILTTPQNLEAATVFGSAMNEGNVVVRRRHLRLGRRLRRRLYRTAQFA